MKTVVTPITGRIFDMNVEICVFLAGAREIKSLSILWWQLDHRKHLRGTIQGLGGATIRNDLITTPVSVLSVPE